jgi:hypothetical protein
MDLLKEDLNEKKRIIVTLENLNIAITHELKEAIIKGNQKNIFLENLILAITAIASNPFFIDIFNCKYYNILPSFLTESQIIVEICAIIQHQILPKILSEKIDPSTIDINLRFDQIQQMGIELSQFRILSYLSSQGVPSIIEIVSSVVDNEELRYIVAIYRILIEQDSNLKNVCEQFYATFYGRKNAKDFMSLVISIMNFIELCKIDDTMDHSDIKLLRDKFLNDYGEMGVNFIIKYCHYYHSIIK